MKTRSFLNRTAAFALVLMMLVPFLPVFDSAAKAAAEGVNYVSLPITIRDYADDGMLFEYSDADSIGSGGTSIFGGDASVTPNLKMKNSVNTANINGTFSMTESTAYTRYTVTGSGAYITWYLSDYYREGGYTRNDLRYAALKYRTSAAASGTPEIYHRYTNSAGSVVEGTHASIPQDGYNKSDFSYVVIDLGGGDATVNYVTLKPKLASGNYIDIGHVAFFETAAEASAYNSLQQNGASEVGNTYHMGNNMLYGLLMPNRATMDYTKSTHTMNPNGDVDTFMHGYLGAIQPGSSSASSFGNITSVDIPGGSPYRALVWSKYYNVEGAEYLDVTLENGARQQLYGGRARVGLVEPSISASSKKLVYKQNVVDYLAWVLEKSLAVPKQNADGSYNYNFVQGEKLAELGNKDLATVLRENINGGKGTYSDAKSRFNSGALVHPADCDTYYEAAYFLLHSTFTTNTGYGKALNNPYHELQLIETTNAAGEVCYKFSSAYTETAYDSTNGLIYNTQQVNAPGKVSGWGYGMTTYDNHFNPIPNDGYGITGSKALDISGYNTNAELYGRNNYNLSLEGHAQFVYREDANQYFTFTGDDDVYLFINNVLAMDLGGAHAISEVTIQLKDVAETCGLVDGGVYDFDFYYMERHGTAANFAIETNIQIADPSMVTTKTGYQNGSEVGYNGFIDPALPVNYQFTLQNNGAAALENLTFSDPKLNTYLSKDSITLNSETTWSDLLLAHYDADGTVKTYIPKGKLTEADLKDALADGILEGEKLLVFGFKHKVGDGTGGTANEWVDNDDGTHSFPNVVYTTAKVENADRILNGQADYVVRKQNVTIDPFHLYSWGENVVQDDGTTAFVLKGSVSITYAEAIDPIIEAYQRKGLTAPDLTGGTVAITNASGNADSTAVNPRATVDDENGISHAAAGTGMDSYYYVVTNADNVKYGPVRVDVYTYAVSDNTYVLDYGLAVELNDDQFGFRTNDVLQLDVNAYPTEVVIDSITAPTSNYGTFAYDYDKASLTYTPSAIMNDKDNATVVLHVKEQGSASVTKFTGVTMLQDIITAPANVVYYEENFPGITYVEAEGNDWVQYTTVDENGNIIAGTMQSADQSSNYGSDPNYAVDKNGLLADDLGNVIATDTFVLDASDLNALQQAGVEYLNEYLLGGDSSNGTIKELEVKTTADVMYFEFVGTGFEILSRTTQDSYAVIDVSVQKKNDSGNWQEYTYKPVITESKGGDLYQVPIISITGLPHDTYRVVVNAAGERVIKGETISRILYIDGIRIYGPLSDEKALDYYNPEEYQAEFFEVKQLIEDGSAIYAGISNTGDKLLLMAGDTVIEDTTDSGFVLTSAADVDEYMSFGPNNELYIDPTSTTTVIAFFLTPDENVPESARTIEIGAHRKADSATESNGYVDLVYGSTADVFINAFDNGTANYEIYSGTEQYYTVDVKDLVLGDDGRYLVMIGAVSNENSIEVLAFTSLKIAGYEIEFAAPAMEMSDFDPDEGLPNMPNTALGEVKKYYSYVAPKVKRPTETMPGTEEPEAPEPEVPEQEEPVAAVNEALTVDSAALKAANVVSGKAASLAVKSSTLAAEAVVYDANGEQVELKKANRSEKDGVVTFTLVFTVTGERGQVLDFTVQLLDAEGLVSANTETVSVTIK